MLSPCRKGEETLLLFIKLNAGLELESTQAIFIEIVAIGLVYAEGSIGVVIPASAVIYDVIDTANLVTA